MSTGHEFPLFADCGRCGKPCRIIQRELYEMPEGVAGVVWARCRRCRRNFVQFVGDKDPVAILKERWLAVH